MANGVLRVIGQEELKDLDEQQAGCSRGSLGSVIRLFSDVVAAVLEP